MEKRHCIQKKKAKTRRVGIHLGNRGKGFVSWQEMTDPITQKPMRALINAYNQWAGRGKIYTGAKPGGGSRWPSGPKRSNLMEEEKSQNRAPLGAKPPIVMGKGGKKKSSVRIEVLALPKTPGKPCLELVEKKASIVPRAKKRLPTVRETQCRGPK